jgi:Flp pilus assembly protein TadG
MSLFTKPAHGLMAKPRRHLHCSATEFWRARQAVAAVEFTLILPFLILLMLGSVEVARLIIFSRNVTQVAATTVEMLSQNGSGTVNYVDLHFAQDSAMVIFPQILQDAAQKNISWGNDISVSMASICFGSSSTTCTPTCTSNCTYANVVWNSGSNKRVCGVPLNPVADTAVPSKTTLPTDVFGPGSLIVVDIAFNYTPMFGLGLFGTISLKHSAYLAPRYVPLIKYAVISGDDGIGAECAGY